MAKNQAVMRLRGVVEALRGASADVRYSVRGWRRRPGVPAAVVLLLGWGVAAGTVAFAVLYGMLVRPLPYADAERVVRVGVGRVGQPGAGPMYRRGFEELRASARSFEQLAGHAPRTLAWAGPEGPVLLRGATVSPSIFPLLRARLQAGRPFTDAEARFGRDRVVVLSHRAWRGRFGSDPAAVGRALNLGGTAYVVVGVLAEGVAFPDAAVDFWIPMTLGSPDPGLDRIVARFAGLGRLRPGVSADRAAAEVDAILRRSGVVGGAARARVVPLQAEMTAAYRPALAALASAAGLMLILVAVNAAGLLLARLFTRYRELAVRGAIGAAPGRIVRSLLFESVMLSVAGGVVGLGAAALLLGVGAAAAPPAARLVAGAGDGPVLAFAAGLAVAVGLLAGAWPAFHWWRSSAVRPLAGLAAAAGDGRIPGVNRARSGLVVVQIAVALVLLVGAGLLLRSFVRLVTIDPGYEADGVLTARFSFPDRLDPGFDGVSLAQVNERFDDERRFYEAAVESLGGLERVSEVEAVGFSSFVPLSGMPPATLPFEVAGRPALDEPPARARVVAAGPGYFAALRPHVREGRVFTPRDTAGSPRVALVNETLAREALGTPAVGRRLVLMAGTRAASAVEVVGVVADASAPGVAPAGPRAAVYVPRLQSAVSHPDGRSSPSAPPATRRRWFPSCAERWPRRTPAPWRRTSAPCPRGSRPRRPSRGPGPRRRRCSEGWPWPSRSAASSA